MSKNTKMYSESAARIQAANAKQGDGKTTKDSFVARAQKAASKNATSKK